MTDLEKKYKYTTIEESIAEKSWACGSKEQSDVDEFNITLVNGQPVGKYGTYRYSPAWWKMIDEPIVNALDHFIRSIGTPTPVTSIKIYFTETGRVKIFNNGSGVEVEIHKKASEENHRTIWIPTMVFGIPLQGSNRERAPDCIVGGENGFGSKISGILSTDSIVETVDRPGGRYFLQQWHDHKTKEGIPLIIGLNDKAAINKHHLTKDRIIPHTSISFQPDYIGLFGYKEFNIDTYRHLVDVVRTRAYYAAAYVNYTLATLDVKSGQKFDLTFNDEPVKCKSISDIAEIFFPNTPMVKAVIRPDAKQLKSTGQIRHYKYPWEVCAIITDTSHYNRGYVSVVNGIMVGDGKHITRITNLITSGVEEKISKTLGEKGIKFSQTHVTNNVFILLNSKIPNPDWTGQRKDVLSNDLKMFAGYTLETKFTTVITEAVKSSILDSIFTKRKTTNKNNPTYDKYTAAKNAGTKLSTQCALIAAEGDSAKSQLEIAINNSVGMVNYGVISTGGVPVNVRKECSVIETNTAKYVKLSNMLQKNLFFNALIDLMGLDTNSNYDPESATYRREWNAINYKKGLIICVDQDLDGKGNILGSLLSTFEVLWPNLIKAGFVRWLSTPIIRAFPKIGRVVHSFHTVQSYEQWCKSNDATKYVARYYKGIGTHSSDETAHILRTLDNHLYTYYLDAESKALFNAYYGEDSSLRKFELSKPKPNIPSELVLQQDKTKLISCSDQLRFHADEYQRDNLERKLYHVIDGQNQAGRKILDGLLKYLKTGMVKVEKIAGPISEHENYHHGGASLGKSIQGKAFVAVGGKQLPILVPESNLGSRLAGGDDASSARYTDVSLNKRLTSLLFPEADYGLLEFNFDEGKRGEPKYFVPLLPLAICEFDEMPGHGWKLKVWARCVYKVIENVRRLITIDDNISLLDMPVATCSESKFRWTGSFRNIRGKPFSIGKYRIIEGKGNRLDVIIVNELPIRTWTVRYVEQVKEKMGKDPRIIESIYAGGCSDTAVNIEITLKPGALTLLDTMGDSVYTDGIEEYFLLREHMDSHINLMGVHDEVMEFNNYQQVMYPWFQMRKAYYGKRIERELMLLELQIVRLENIIRYIRLADGLKMPGQTDSQMQATLTDNKFDRVYNAKINNPGFTPTSELRNKVLTGPKATYDYLLDLTDRRKSIEGLKQFERELEAARKSIDDINEKSCMGRFPGAVIFEAEINAIEEVISEGMRTTWKFTNADRFQYQ